ncbi:Spy/CpxP family protein refolding chaperone [bacterium]|nr:Spy/CpxP family protein refolding chaperone [bacterium]
MKKYFTVLFILSISLLTTSSYALSDKQKEFDTMLNKRLNLTPEQQEYIKQNRPKHREEIIKTYDKMKEVHDKIQEVYSLSDISKFQADVKTAPMKAELAILKQSAHNTKMKNRKQFENILTKEQKIEFEKIKKEYHSKAPNSEKRAEN